MNMPERQSEIRTKKGEQTLLTALLLSAPGPALISYAAFAKRPRKMAVFSDGHGVIANLCILLMYHKPRESSVKDTDIPTDWSGWQNTPLRAMSVSGTL